MSARVSIGMPLYNAERFVESALDSILAQTFTDFELIISDNASTDRTEEICRRYAAADARIAYSRNPRNMGATYNYNRTFELATGEYFRHAAYDDLLAPTNIERCVEALDRQPEVVLAYPRMEIMDGDGKLTGIGGCDLDLRMKTPHERLRAWVRRGNFGTMCDPVFGLFRSSALRKTPVLGSYISADSILLAEIALHGEICEIPETLFFERLHAGGSVQSNPTMDDRYAWFDPNNRGKITNRLPNWRWLVELVRAISRAPLDPAERLRCYAVVRHWIWFTKRGLIVDAVSTVAYLARSFATKRRTEARS